MLRYLRLFGCFVRFSISRAMEFRVDFFFRIVMDITFYAVNILFFEVIFLHTPLLGGWDAAQMRVFIGCFLLVDAISMTLFANNLWMLSTYINRGDLDYYLVRPVSSLFFLSLRDFAANSFLNLLMAAGILAWGLAGLGEPLPPGGLIMLLVLLINGTYLRYCVRMLTIIPSFWLHAGQGFEIVFFHLARLIDRPHRIFTGPVRVLLTTALPFSLMASAPAALFLDGFHAGLFGMIVAVTLAFTLLLRVLWQSGLRAYASASS